MPPSSNFEACAWVGSQLHKERRRRRKGLSWSLDLWNLERTEKEEKRKRNNDQSKTVKTASFMCLYLTTVTKIPITYIVVLHKVTFLEKSLITCQIEVVGY